MFTIPQAIDIYKEEARGVNFSEIKDFVKGAFPGVAVRVKKAKKKIVCTKGLLFDFLGTQASFAGIGEVYHCNIILTEKLFATIGEDKRLHIRASIYSHPSVISLRGIVEAPAKPKEFYIYKQRYAALNTWSLKEPVVKKKFKGQFIDYDDRRLTEVLKGYIAQAIFFHATGNPFCDKKACRLYNAHWQRDLIYSQIEKGKFCKSHQNVLTKIKKTQKSKK